MFIHEFVDPDDPKGRTHKQINLEKNHAYEIGSLVEIIDDDEHYEYEPYYNGARLYVVAHHRDCDGTPLYAMSADKNDTFENKPGFANPTWVHGFTEESLKLIHHGRGDR